MVNEHDHLAELSRNRSVITSDEKAKKSAISNAMEAYDKKYASSRQGSVMAARLPHVANVLRESLIEGVSMKRSYVFAGGVCLGLVVVGLVGSTYLTPAELGIRVQKDHVAEREVAAYKPPPMTKRESGQAIAPAPSPQEQDFSALLSKVQSRNAGGAGYAGGSAPQMRTLIPAAMPEGHPYYYQDQGRDKFASADSNSTKITTEEPVSTFSIDVDTASYAFVRTALNGNRLPPKDAIRIEEMVNYFPYAYQVPTSKAVPFKANVAVVPTPWNEETKLLRIGIKGYTLTAPQKPKANLVFLIDTSGSMQAPNKLPLVQHSLKMLLDTLSSQDRVAIVAYAGSAGIVLEPTLVSEKSKIIHAIDTLGAGGSTAGAAGIQQAYALAEANFNKENINRVLLATDGDFNVGVTDPEQLKRLVEKKRETGIFLSVLGFGTGNYNDALMQTLAQNGNGNAAYIDTINEARKTLVEEATSTLFPIAKDVKIQVEFNPATVSKYRLIGYETRMLKREDFNNDRIDAGDIGAGHTVTALYEMTPAGSNAAKLDALRYVKPAAEVPVQAHSDEYAFVKIRYKEPDGNATKLITTPVNTSSEQAADSETQFAVAVASLGALLKGDGTIHDFSYDDVIALAQSGKGEDPFGYRAEFINLVRITKNINPRN